MSVVETIIETDALLAAWQRVRQNQGMAGGDGVTIQQFEPQLERQLQALQHTIRSGEYLPLPLKRVELKRPGKKPRQLSIPSVRDRILQTAISQYLMPLFEPHFERCSYGYRPGRSYRMAVNQVCCLREQGYHWLLDADIKQYFDNIPQQQLLDEIKRYIGDAELNNLIRATLLQPQGNQLPLSFGNAVGLGIPQGSPLSPLLANLYLDPLDELMLENRLQMIRYADDFIVMCKHASQARQAFDLATEKLEQLGLTMNQEKTQVVSFQQGFQFLGHSFINDLAIDEKSQQHIHPQQIAEDLPDIDADPAVSSSMNEQELADNHYEQLRIQPILNRALFDDEPFEGEFELPDSETPLHYASRMKTLYVTQVGCVLKKQGNRIIIQKSGEVLQSVPAHTLDLILLFGRNHLTFDVNVFCLSHNIPVVYANQAGQFYGLVDNYAINSTGITKAQVEHAETLANQLAIARSIIRTKLNNALVVMRRIARNRASQQQQQQLAEIEKQYSRMRNRIDRLRSLNRLRGIEGLAARYFFGFYSSLLPAQWQFSRRNRRPPKDPANALLSLGYTVLFNNMLCFIKGRGLHAQFGYLHSGHNGQPALALDLIEAYRAPVVDALVFKLLHSNQFSAEDFDMSYGACSMSKAAKKRFLIALEAKLQSRISHPKEQFISDYRRLMDYEVQQFKRLIVEGRIDYRPLSIR